MIVDVVATGQFEGGANVAAMIRPWVIVKFPKWEDIGMVVWAGDPYRYLPQWGDLG